MSMDYKQQIKLNVLGVLLFLTLMYPIKFHSLYYKVKLIFLIYFSVNLIISIIKNKKRRKNERIK